MERCPFCGTIAEMIWVRAHYQCANCGQITVPCCNGETADECPLPDGADRVDYQSVPSEPQSARGPD